MRRILNSLLFIAVAFTSKADMPGPAYQYDMYSQNESFYFKSIPFYNYDLTTFGKTIIYEAATKRKLYQIDNYLPQEAFISNNGRSLATIRYWMWGHDNFDDQPLIEFFVNGEKSRKYFVKDLIVDRTKLQFTSSHTLWYDQAFIENDTLYVVTTDKKIVLIDINKAEIIGRKDKSFMTGKFDLKNLPRLKSIVYDKIKYPNNSRFPDLVSGAKFHQALVTALNKMEVDDYSKSKFFIQVYGAIDRQGNCEIFMLRASVDGKENKQWEKEVSDWVTKQKFKVDLIPVNCDKWVFTEYFYLK